MRRIFYSVLFLSGLLVSGPTGALAAPKQIKGQLSVSGYQIFASDPSGNSVVSKEQKFSLKANFKKGTLALVDSSGNASGPVVLAIRNAEGKAYTYEQALSAGVCSESGANAVTGFQIRGKKNKKGVKKFRLNLGQVTVDSSNGFAYSSKKYKKKELFGGALASVDANCIPAGAGGKLGLTAAESSVLRATFIALDSDDFDNDGVGNGNDPDDDNDGIADQFDLDSNGDGILDFYQKDPGGNFPGGDDDDEDDEDDGDDDGGPIDDDDDDIDDDEYFGFVFSNLQVDINDTLNLHTGSFEQSDIDSLVSGQLNIAMGLPGDGELPIEVDCSGLSYCTLGGTGTIANYGDGPSVGLSFPDSFDDDGDGFGRVDEVALENPFKDFFLKPNADASQIKPGNVLTQLIEDGSRTVVRPRMLEFVFNTVPAIKTIKLGENNLSTETISYPVGDTDPGTFGHCFEHDISDGHKIELTVFRPQRPGITAAGEDEFMDMGNLRIVVSVNHDDGGIVYCPAEAFSTTDPNLEPFTGFPGDTDPNQELGLLDVKGDVAFDESTENTFTFTLDLQACTGATTGTTTLDLKMRTPRNDNSGQRFCIERS